MSSLGFSWKCDPFALCKYRVDVPQQHLSDLQWDSLSPSTLLSLLQAEGFLQVIPASEPFSASLSLTILCLLGILRKILSSSEQEKFSAVPRQPRHLSPLRSSNVSCRFMTAWTATAVGFSPIPLSPVWRRCSTRSAETRQNWSWSTSWYVPLLPRDCSGARTKVPGRCLQG